jgi:hypothetical protein
LRITQNSPASTITIGMTKSFPIVSSIAGWPQIAESER